MGCRVTFQCIKCGYAEMVSGGPDRGFDAHTLTVQCLKCKSLMDILTGRDLDPPGEKPTKKPRCSKCRSTRVKPWVRGDRCPRCEGQMSRTDGPSILWD